MVDENGLRFEFPTTEPLKTAFTLPLAFRREDSPKAFGEPVRVWSIEQLSRFRRLEAAVAADVYLFQRSQRYLRRGPGEPGDPRPDGAEQVVLALTVWAWTRNRLGFEDAATIAMSKAVEWAEEVGFSSLRGFVYRRSARMLIEQLTVSKSFGPPGSRIGSLVYQDVIREMQTAFSDHRKTPGGEAAVTGTMLEYGAAFTISATPQVGRRLLLEGLERLEEHGDPDPVLQLDARAVLVRSYLKHGRLEEAEEAAAPLDPERLEPRDRYLWLHLQADLHRAVGRRGSAFARRLEALAVGLELCGPERVLDDLAAVGRDRPETPELSEEAERCVTDATWALAGRIARDEEWRRGIRTLARSVLSGSEPEDGWEPVALRKRLYRVLRLELASPSDEDDRTTEFSDGGEA